MTDFESIKQELFSEISTKFVGDSSISKLKDFCIEKLEYVVKQKLNVAVDAEAHQACELFGITTWEFFFTKGFEQAGFEILLSGWNLLSELQTHLNKHVYRASIGAFSAIRYRNLKDRGASFRWSLLTQAEDLLGEHKNGGGTGKDLLILEFGLVQEHLQNLQKIATQNIEIIKRNNNWSIPEAFSEDIVTKFIYRNPGYAVYFAMSTNVFEYKINKSYFNAMFQKVNEDSSTPTEKGNNLEDFATYLFLLIPGLVPRRNILEETDAYETDIVVTNHTLNNNIISELLGRHFLVECKNWKDRVGVKDVGYFLLRMRLTHASFGILFAKNGITGDEEKAANSLIRKSFHEDGNICIVIDKEILVSLMETSLTFWPLILEKVERIRFGVDRRKEE